MNIHFNVSVSIALSLSRCCMFRCVELYNNPALIHTRIRLFDRFDFEKRIAANLNTRYLSSLLCLSAGHSDISKDTSGKDLK